MMTFNRASTIVLLVLALVLDGVTGCSSVDPHKGVVAISRSEDLTKERVEALLHESPQEYLVAVQEVVDDSKCYGPADGSSCPLTVKVVEFIAGEPGRSVERVHVTGMAIAGCRRCVATCFRV